MTTPTRPLVVLCGPPGAGKTSVGAAVARRAEVAFLDTDQEIERLTGRTVAQIFAEDGEAEFRRLEHATITDLLTRFGGVLALGGGAVMDPRTRQALRGHRVLYLHVDTDAAVARLRRSRTVRPLLQGPDPQATYAQLLRERESAYREVATCVVDTSSLSKSRSVEEAVHVIAHAPTRIRVDGARPYEVIVGHDLTAQVVELAATSRVLVLHAPAVADVAHRLTTALQARGSTVTTHALPDAEAAKTQEVITGLWELCGELNLGRDDTIVAVGGGATTDLAGFLAATWLRGIRLVNVPTTLLGMVDAAVGGKTGINTAHGKNLVGSFHPPVGVVCDLSTLTTLPIEDLRAGLGEVVKCGFIADPRILEQIEANPAAALDPTSALIRDVTERSIAVKARVVGEDLTEQGLREILNYGHTFAHVIEREEDYAVRHGEAVAIGMVFAGELAVREIGTDPALVERTRAVLTSLGLPTGYDGSTFERLREAMSHDKKRRADSLRFVLLREVAAPTTHKDPTEEHLQQAWRAVSRAAGADGTGCAGEQGSAR